MLESRAQARVYVCATRACVHACVRACVRMRARVRVCGVGASSAGVLVRACNVWCGCRCRCRCGCGCGVGGYATCSRSSTSMWYWLEGWPALRIDNAEAEGGRLGASRNKSVVSSVLVPRWLALRGDSGVLVALRHRGPRRQARAGGRVALGGRAPGQLKIGPEGARARHWRPAPPWEPTGGAALGPPPKSGMQRRPGACLALCLWAGWRARQAPLQTPRDRGGLYSGPS